MINLVLLNLLCLEGKMNADWCREVCLGDRIRLENIPFSQKHFHDDSLWEYFIPVEGRVCYVSLDEIHLLDGKGERIIFRPIPPLSGQVIVHRIPDTWEKKIHVGDMVTLENDVLPMYIKQEGNEKYLQGEVSGCVVAIAGDTIHLEQPNTVRVFHVVPSYMGTLIIKPK